MHPYFSTLFFIIFLVISIDLAACDDEDPNYTNCSKRFECGRIRDVGYPFWGDGRAEYCGHFGYQLRCNRDKDQEIPEIEIKSVRYQVLSLSESTKTMSIARSDFMDDPCPANPINSTIDTSPFQYSATTTVNLSLFYECDSPSSAAPNQFSCGGTNTTSYFNVIDPSIISTCRYKNIVVQVFKAGFDRLTRLQESLGQVLKGGFDVEYVVDVSQCKGCVDSGGQCGFDNSASQRWPVCFCFNGPSPELTCFSRPPPKAKGMGVLFSFFRKTSSVSTATMMIVDENNDFSDT